MKNLTQESWRDLERRKHEESLNAERMQEDKRQLESLGALASSQVRVFPDVQTTAAASISVAPELVKLAKHHESDVPTGEDFERQKRSILNRDVLLVPDACALKLGFPYNSSAGGLVYLRTLTRRSLELC